MSKAVTRNWEAMVQSFFCARDLPWGGMPLDNPWSLPSCFRKIERVHRATYVSVEMQAVSLFLLAVFNISVVLYISVGSGADTNFIQTEVYEDVAGLNVESRSSNKVFRIVRLLSIQHTSNYIIPLIPKDFSLCNFIPLNQLDSFMSLPDAKPDTPFSVTLPLAEGVPLYNYIPLTDESSFLHGMPDDVVILKELPSPSREDLVSLVPQTIVIEGPDRPCDLLVPLVDRSVSVSSLTLGMSNEIVVESQPQTLVTSLLLSDGVSSVPPISQELDNPLISDDWGIVTATRLDEFATCYEIHSSRFVLQDYILLRNSIEIPDDGPCRSRRGRVPPWDEQDCWEVVTLYTISPGVLVIKIELEIISSDYFICFN